ncbi:MULTISPECIES: Mov34/MPN/PAD-1 family protein [unclassified Bradyrhizobium]|uniref:Mov34/MPN/PAD-1 family protein n=1 Tax=unclassified Bradyrhizobium TaxID=2631580 RepID=UPI003396723F
MYAFYQERNGLYPVAMSVVLDAVKHAEDVYPQESCGVVIDNKYWPMINGHMRPNEDFYISPGEYIGHIERCGPLQAVIHSHPQGQPGPSRADMIYQQNAGVPFGIIVIPDHHLQDVVFFGDTVPIAPEVGRPFIHGVYDCYALGRDYLRAKYGLVLPNFPRDAEWWLHTGANTNLLEENFEAAGFVPVGFNEMRPGDALMCRFAGSDKINHCGVYTGNGLVLHHLAGSPKRIMLSTEEPVYNWRRFATHALRHKSFLQGPAT